MIEIQVDSLSLRVCSLSLMCLASHRQAFHHNFKLIQTVDSELCRILADY